MKNVKEVKVIKTVERISESVYNAMQELGGNMDNYVMVGTRLKTDAKLIAMEEQNATLFEAYSKIKEIHNDVLQERFNLGETPYKVTVTIKKA